MIPLPKATSLGGLVGPARAGMIRKFGQFLSKFDGWPRTSGDDPNVTCEVTCPSKLAPHERG